MFGRVEFTVEYGEVVNRVDRVNLCCEMAQGQGISDELL